MTNTPTMNSTPIMKQFESFRLDLSSECLWQDKQQVTLPPRTFAVLRYLVENPARLVTHDELLEALWPNTYVQPQVLRTYVLELRKVLGDDAAQPRFIQTLPKRGYRFIAPVRDWTKGEGTGTERSTLPGGGAAKAVSLAGREKELAQLMAQVGTVTQSERRTVFITGEAGIGKSALVEAFSQQAVAARELSVARGQCVQGFAGREEYYPVMEALGQLCASPDGGRACEVLARLAPAWLSTSRQIPQPGAIADRMPGDLCSALEELSADRALILIFEDLNWADQGTLHLISALARRRAPARLLLLATFRAQALASEDPLKALRQDLLMRRLCEEIALQPLTKEAVRELLTKQLQQAALPKGLTSFVHQYSEGNPLFAIALLEHLRAERSLVCDQKDGMAVWKERTPFHEMEDRVPSGLAQMIELDMDCLAQADQRLLEAGSIMGVAFPVWSVAAALGMDEDEAEEALDALAHRLYFLDRAGQDELPDGGRSSFYVFAHGLYRDVIYRRQSESRRARWHIRIAERLGQLFQAEGWRVAREVAYHYEAASSWPHAIEALHAAAGHALERDACAAAVDLLEHALRLVEKLPASQPGQWPEQLRRQLTRAQEAFVLQKTAQYSSSASSFESSTVSRQ